MDPKSNPQQQSNQSDAPQTQQSQIPPHIPTAHNNQQFIITTTAPSNGSGAIIGAIICLFLAMVVQLFSANLLFIFYVPLYIVSFILSIVIMSQGNAGKGVLTLLMSLGGFWLVLLLQIILVAVGLKSAPQKATQVNKQTSLQKHIQKNTLVLEEENEKQEKHEAWCHNDKNDIAKFKASLNAGVVLLEEDCPLEMIKEQAGQFYYTIPRFDYRNRKNGIKGFNVKITRDFWLGKYEVTQKQFNAVMKYNPSIDYLDDTLPVQNISWHEAKAFCDVLNECFEEYLPEGYYFDLPTNSQWEIATKKSSDNDTRTISFDDEAWYRKNSDRTPHPVGKKQPNFKGYYDMGGNVSEWCRDAGRSISSYEEIVADVSDVCEKGGTKAKVNGLNYCQDSTSYEASCKRTKLTDKKPFIGFRLALVHKEEHLGADDRELPINMFSKNNKEYLELLLAPNIKMNLCKITVQKEPFHLELPEKNILVSLTDDYYVGETEVTQLQWKTIMGKSLYEQAKLANAEENIGNEADDFPIYYVSWNDAMDFCNRLNKRKVIGIPKGYHFDLLTITQQIYACCAGKTNHLYISSSCNGNLVKKGLNNYPSLDPIAWYAGNSSVKYAGIGWNTSKLVEKQYPGGNAGPRLVKTKEPNLFGLYDMLGNVAEWSKDCVWDTEYAKTKMAGNMNPIGPSNGKKGILGGCWQSPYCSAVVQECSDSLDLRNNYIGFRLALVKDK